MFAIYRQTKQTLKSLLTGQTPKKHLPLNAQIPTPVKSSANSDGYTPLNTKNPLPPQRSCILCVVATAVGAAVGAVIKVLVFNAYPIIAVSAGMIAGTIAIPAKTETPANISDNTVTPEMPASNTGKSDVASS